MRGNVASVFAGHADWAVQQGDVIEFARSLPDNAIDLLFCSPPYENARSYSIGFKLVKQGWVDWMVEVVKAVAPKVKGLMAVVCEGKTRQFKYSATPVLLMADLHRAGFNLRKPPVFHRVGIAGSGGPDWLRNDFEFVACVTRPGRLPWSANTACGEPPKWAPGGEMSHRMPNGRRVAKLHTKGVRDGKRVQGYNPPKIANPGNVLRFDVGGGRMGHDLSHQNEAPFPLGLAEFFVKSFCPPGGVVLDLFAGSSTTGHAAIKNGRRYIGSDLRESQVELSARRLREVELEMRGQSEVAGGCAGGGGGDPAAPVGEPGGAVCAAVGGG